MKSVQRIISMILALSLILEFCPQAALATETEQTQETEIAVTATETTAPAELVTEPVEESATPTEAVTELVEETALYVAETTAEEIASFAAVNDAAALSGNCGKNVTWNFEEATGTLTLSGTGEMPSYDSSNNSCPWLHLSNQITVLVVESGITSIGQKNFSACYSLAEIFIPSTLTYFDENAFPYYPSSRGASLYYAGSREQWALVSISGHSMINECLHHFNTVYTPINPGEGENITWSLEDGVLTISGEGDMNMLPGRGTAPWYDLREEVTSVIIEEGITSIGFGAFRGFGSLYSFEIPSSVTVIGREAFVGFSAYCKIEIPYGVTTIEPYAFANFSDSYLELPETVTRIGYGAFKNSDLGSIVIPEGITTIEDYTFCRCSYLRDITIPDSVTSIGYSAFDYCQNLEEITIPDSVTQIGKMAFAYCHELATVTFPNNLSEIKNGTFYNCYNLTNITLPNNITKIGSGAFYSCDSLTEIDIPDSVTQIAAYAFEGSALTHVNLPSGLTKIESNVFRSTEIANITIPNSVTSIEYGAFSSCDNLTSITIPSSVTSIGNEAFADCTGLTHVTIPDSITLIGSEAFANCTGLTHITIPDSVSGIGQEAFANCTGLTRITIPCNTNISYKAFGDCTNLSSVVFEDDRRSIECSAFYGCTQLSSITVPASVTYISMYTQSLKSSPNIYYKGSEEQWKSVWFDSDNASNITVYCAGTWEDSTEDLPPAYETETEITPGTAATPELNILLDYLMDWLDAYKDWVASVKEGLEDFGASDEESKEAIIRQEADRMRTHDQNTQSRYLTGDLQGYESQAYHALSSFFYDSITSVPNFSSTDLSNDWADSKIANMVINSMDGGSKTYPYDGVEVSIDAVAFMGLNFGTMTIRDRKGNPIGPIIICSDTIEGQKALTAYVGELQELGLNSAFNIANAVYQDILGLSLTALTNAYVTKAVAKIENKLAITLTEKLGIAGVGQNLVTTLDECYTFYTSVKQCIDLGKEEDILGTLEKIKKLEFKDTTVVKEVTKDSMSALRTAHQKMQTAFRDYLNGTIGEEKKGFWRWLFGCPVSISVYNSSGEQIGYVGEDDLWYTDDISITELGGVKEIVSFTEEELSFVVTATDYGTMSCMFEQYDEDFAPVGRLNYYNILLDPEQTFQVSVPETLEEENETAAITSGGEVIYPDEYISAEDSAGVTISCSAVTEDGITGGTVSGTGTYIRGDSVILRAEPYEGFRFVGWFDGEYLMGTETIYEFPARENCEISARFYKQKPILIQLEADVGGGAIGGGRYDSGETVTLIALPQSGYRFAGWYVGEELVSTDEEYSFQAAESLILHAAFLHTAVKGDLNKDGAADIQDAVYLLWNTLFPDLYPVTADADFNNDGIRNSDDAVILLWHTLFPEQYPLP